MATKIILLFTLLAYSMIVSQTYMYILALKNVQLKLRANAYTQLRKLVERKMLVPIHEGARQYTVGFSNNNLLRGVIQAVSAEGFIHEALNRPR